MTQDALFADSAKYAIDTNVIVSFLGDSDSEHYPLDVFKPQWDFLESAKSASCVILGSQSPSASSAIYVGTRCSPIPSKTLASWRSMAPSVTASTTRCAYRRPTLLMTGA